MPTYVFKAMDVAGIPAKGEVEAVSKQDVADQLKQRALHVLETQSENKLLKETLAAVRGDVEAGLLLSDALERHPKVFNPLYVAMVRAGETGGVLEMSLQRTADQLEKDASLRRQVRSAMIYPTL